MKRIIRALFVVLLVCTICTPTVANAKSNQFWVSGFAGYKDELTKAQYKKRIQIIYNGYRVTIKGYGWKGKTCNQVLDQEGDITKLVKLKKKTYKVSKKCRVCCGGGSPYISYDKFLKEGGRKGRFEFYPYVKIKNNKVVRMWMAN